MIMGFVGVMGSGKTLSMTKEVYKYFLKGYKVYSNYDLNFKHEPIDFDTLYTMAEAQIPLTDVLIALDEIHIMLDSRSGMNKQNKTMTFWLNQTRKQKVKLFYTTQYMHQIDKRLRAATDIWNFCDGIEVIKEGKNYFVCYNDVTNGKDSKRYVFIGNDYFNLYNTNEVIKFSQRKK